jgi:tetratricopeptide (TPR) repeat protein
MADMTKNEFYEEYDTKIKDLYTLRDKYYIVNQDCKNADERNECLLSKLNELASELENIDQSKFESKASYLALLGKAYNVLPEFNQKAFDSLTKAIKLDHKSVNAWNYLGECYWKKRDFEMCKNCFEQSLSIQKNKLSLRGMSMVLRQLINVPSNKEQLQTNNNSTNNQQLAKYDQVKNLLEESIKYAKDSLQLDPKDGMSWYILANCYVSKFFSPFGAQNSQLIKQAISAYNLALKDETNEACFQSDLYFNKSMISMYEENWQDVLTCLSKALSLDPFWAEVKDNLVGTINYLSQLNEMISTNGKLKAKKFQSLIESFKKSDLGPYSDGYFVKNQNDKNETKIDLVEVNLKDLQKGLNKNKVLVGKVICGLPSKSTDSLNIVCFTCCIADSNGDCVAMTIYNLAGGHGLIIGQSVAIPEPYVENIDFKFNLSESLKNQNLVREVMNVLNNENSHKADQNMSSFEFKFNSIRVEYPTVLVVNGKKWTREKVSNAFFVPKIIAD